ncbi:MAG: VWA domain-containing protein [Acidobacteria bacterium]|nr:VWA domain-containing protein [Acidobacteriota bacterium]
MNFQYPELLYGLILIPVLLVILLFRHNAAESFFEQTGLSRVRLAQAKDRRFFRWFFLLLALVLLIVSLASPRYGVVLEQGKRKGRDIFLVVDVSKSMNARDLKPSRLAVTKEMVYDLLSRMKNDRVGIIVFAGDAFIQCPLTTDYEAVAMFMDGVDTGITSAAGTDLGRALELASRSFQENTGGYRTVVVFSDGEDFGNNVTAALKKLKENGVIVYTVGVGSTTGAPVPKINPDNGMIAGYMQDENGKTVISKLNAKELEKIAKQTGGAFLRASDTRTATMLAAKLDKLSRRKLEEKGIVRLKNRYQLPLSGAVIALAAFILL